MSSPRSRPVKATKSDQDAAVRRLRKRWMRGGELKQTRKSGESLNAWILRKGLKQSPNTLYTMLEFAEWISTELELDVLLALRLPSGMPPQLVTLHRVDVPDRFQKEEEIRTLGGNGRPCHPTPCGLASRPLIHAATAETGLAAGHWQMPHWRRLCCGFVAR